MRISNNLRGYELIDATCGERLERWADTLLIRPDPHVIWQTEKDIKWNSADAKYIRSNLGGGHWELFRQINFKQILSYKNIKFYVKPMDFKHMGIFPEQATNWDLIVGEIESANRKIKLLNLFGYTGAASLVALNVGATVCHVDSSKGMINLGKENAKLSYLSEKPIRWIIDDCIKFVNREIKRGNKYDIIILDPPSYGNGPRGELWKLNNDIYNFLNLIKELLSENFIFVLLNLYVNDISVGVAEYLLKTTIGSKYNCIIHTEEIGLKVTKTNLVLPCGLTGIAKKF